MLVTPVCCLSAQFSLFCTFQVTRNTPSMTSFLAFFAEHHVFEVHPRRSVYQSFIPLCG